MDIGQITCRAGSPSVVFQCPRRGFSRIELLAVAAGCFAIALFGILPSLGRTVSSAEQISCLNNLRQIGVAFQAWGTDHEDRRPWFVPMEEGGTRLHPLRNGAYLHYTLLSNHLSPTILVDPAETGRAKRRAVDWGQLSQGGFLNIGFRNNAVSYVLGMHTMLTEAHEILAGDRHVQFDGATTCPVAGGTLVQLVRPGPDFRGWSNGAHGLAGNLLLNDGRVEFANREAFKAVVTRPNSFGGDHIVTPH